jgi:bifunctional non-homologous end joining protein LigD
MGPIAAALAALPVEQAILDGEIAAPDEYGVTRVEAVRPTLRRPERLVIFAFDLLWQNGEDLRGARLLERKFRLELLLRGVGAPLLYVEHVPAQQGQGLYTAAVAIGCEGIVSKLADSRYSGGETKQWLKIKPPEVRERQAEAVRKGFERAALRRGIKV